MIASIKTLRPNVKTSQKRKEAWHDLILLYLINCTMFFYKWISKVSLWNATLHNVWLKVIFVVVVQHPNVWGSWKWWWQRQQHTEEWTLTWKVIWIGCFFVSCHSLSFLQFHAGNFNIAALGCLQLLGNSCILMMTACLLILPAHVIVFLNFYMRITPHSKASVFLTHSLARRLSLALSFKVFII